MLKKLSIENIINRIQFCQEQIMLHPEKTDMLNRNIDRQKTYLMELCIANAGDHRLAEITT